MICVVFVASVEICYFVLDVLKHFIQVVTCSFILLPWICNFLFQIFLRDDFLDQHGFHRSSCLFSDSNNSWPLSYAACLKFQSMPEGSWYCSSCNDRPVSSKTAIATDPNLKPIVIRPRRVVKPPESEIGGCVFCRLAVYLHIVWVSHIYASFTLLIHSTPISYRSHDFSVGIFDDRTIILCDQVLSCFWSLWPKFFF